MYETNIKIYIKEILFLYNQKLLKKSCYIIKNLLLYIYLALIIFKIFNINYTKL